jgi:large subunit ribosomal protein L31e
MEEKKEELKQPIPAEETKLEAPKAEAKPEEKAEKKEKAKEKKEDKKEIVLERIYNVPLLKAYKKPETKRGDYAVSLLRQFAARHMKSSEVKIDGKVNEVIKQRGNTHPPKLIKIKATKDKAGVTVVTLAQ